MLTKALLVGINDYAPAGPGGPDLRGCVNDVRLALNTLVPMRVIQPHPSFTRILTDARATREAILAGLRWLLQPTARFERLIFFYSGHGTRTVDTSGDEIDHQDEAICPHDYATAGLIKDDDLAQIFKGARNGVLEVILDSCHSGTGTRELKALEALPEEETFGIRYVEPPVDQQFFIDAGSDVPVRGFMKWETNLNRLAVPVMSMNHVLWAACADNQTAAEARIGGQYNGVFSYCFFQTVAQTGFGIPRRQLDAIVNQKIHSMGYTQTAQVEGSPAELGDPVFKDILKEYEAQMQSPVEAK